MPKKKNVEQSAENKKPAEIVLQPITETIEKNFMSYAMSVIVARAIPEIDGFKPAHRKLLYTMYKMGLMTGERTKSANVVGQTMHLNPHGNDAIYDTLVRLTHGNETLLHPFIDSKGSFGKCYSRDMDPAAQRYTNVKLDPFCNEIFRGINMNAVDFIDNYDGTTKEPLLLPTSFPNILVTPNLGIAVGMASNICSFNLNEICDGAIQLLRSPETTVDQMVDIVKAPDFSIGANLIYNREQLKEIYQTGRGSFKLRSRYSYDKTANCIDILQIPYSTTIELILKRISDLVKEGKLKEIVDFRDEIDLNGFKLTLDLRRGIDPDKLMLKLFKLTPLEDGFDCNFNILIDGSPKQIGVIEILHEWIRFRIGCVKRELTYELERKQEKLHLLIGLSIILLDIDKAIKIVRDTAKEKEVVPNLMKGFDLDEIQAEYIAEIRLRNLNREYILNRIEEIESLQKEIAELTDIIGNETKLKGLIIKQLKEVKSKYGKPRQTQLIYDDEIKEYNEEEHVEAYNVRLIVTHDGYFKKITLQSLRGNDEQKLKENDYIILNEEASNANEIMFFSDKAQVYKAKINDFDTSKASELGEYIPAKLGFDDGEKLAAVKCLSEYNPNHTFIFIFKNGKGVRIPVSAYETKTNRKRLTGAYSDVSPVVAVLYESEPYDIMLIGDDNKAVIINSSLISVKTTRNSIGVVLYQLKPKRFIAKAETDFEQKYTNIKRYKKSKIPASGILLEEVDIAKQQMSIF
ncbi:MAG: DNA topoisomerase (ATP-hydrolyzing) subunit A [Oscillospiraceae bacterium]|nr:DNA topoisomerase (ATP-hydrolyzing) subunit A [Oscillospiraceae bacterium]